MDRQTISRLRVAEERARLHGHVLEPWQVVYPEYIGGSVAYVAACGACGAAAFAHRRIIEYGDAAHTVCTTAGKADAAMPSLADLSIVA